MIPACFDYQDPADARGWDDEVTRVDECVHGEHPIECSLCTSAGFIAAVSGEEEDMQDPDKSHWNGRDELDADELASERERVINDWIDTANLMELRRVEIKVANKVEVIRTEHKRREKELAMFDKPQRATRKDAGMKREEYKATKGAA